jgi:hypothetical protein
VDEDEARKLYSSCVRETCSGRRLFITKKGYMGIGMKGALKGDHIVVLPGGIFPCLLRDQGDYFTAIGESYVHGLDLDGIMIDEDLILQHLTLQ